MPTTRAENGPPPIALRVDVRRQAASGGSHLTVFDADVDVIDGGSGVEVRLTGEAAADPSVARFSDWAADACEAIGRGVAGVLEPRGLGGTVVVVRLLLHPIDFKPRQFERHAAQALEAALAERGGGPS